MSAKLMRTKPLPNGIAGWRGLTEGHGPQGGAGQPTPHCEKLARAYQEAAEGENLALAQQHRQMAAEAKK
ncbi:hypothetical protein [Cupriavidus basilensis]